jgi:hypothetical protein
MLPYAAGKIRGITHIVTVVPQAILSYAHQASNENQPCSIHYRIAYFTLAPHQPIS